MLKSLTLWEGGMRLLFFDVLLILTLLLQPFYIYLAYRVGKGEELRFKIRLFNHSERELTKEEKRELKEWKNILNYDGTKESQEEIY